MKAPSTKVRFAEAEKLLDYGFNSFTFKELGKKDDVVGEFFVNKGVNSSIEAVLENDVGTLIKKGNDKEISQELNLQNNISAPVKLGELTFSSNGEQIATVNIVAKNDSQKINLGNVTKKVFYSWGDLLRNSY